MTAETTSMETMRHDIEPDFILHHNGHSLDVRCLYARMWGLATPVDRGEIRRYAPKRNSSDSFKWLVKELSGAEAYKNGTSTPNKRLRECAQARMHTLDLAIKDGGSSFLLLGGSPERAFGVTNGRDGEGVAEAERSVSITAVPTQEFEASVDFTGSSHSRV